MFSLLLALHVQLTTSGLLVPERRIISIGRYSTHWLAYTRTAGGCKTYAAFKGYQRYFWTPEYQPSANAITGTCSGIKSK